MNTFDHHHHKFSTHLNFIFLHYEMEPTRMPIYPVFRPEGNLNVIDIDRNRTIAFNNIVHEPGHPSRIKINVCSRGVDFFQQETQFEMNVPIAKRAFNDFFYNNLDNPAKGEHYSDLFMECRWIIKVIPPTSERLIGFRKHSGGIMFLIEDRHGERRTRSINDFGVWTEICLAVVESVRGFLKRKGVKHIYKTSFSETEHMYTETMNPFGHSEYYMCLFRKKKLLKDDMERQFRGGPSDYIRVEYEDDGMVPNGEDL